MDSIFLFPEREVRVPTVARLLDCTKENVRYLARAGRLPGRRLSLKIWVFRVADVRDFQAARDARHE